MEYDLLIISGCTGVGKTALSLELAKKLNIEIISADSMQIYKSLDIGTSKISKDEIKACPHHMIDIVSPFQSFNVFEYVEQVKKIVPQIIERHNLPVIVGGTGLYIESLIKNYSFGKDNTSKILFNVKHIFLYRDRSVLYKNIDKRVDQMIEQGLVNEVTTLHEMGVSDDAQCMQAIGYKEICAYLNNETTLEKAIDDIKQNSRNYAKRQLTWFRHMDCEWVSVDNGIDNILNELTQFYKQYKK